MRVIETKTNADGNLELKLNHPIEVKTPTVVLFKAGADAALLKEINDGGYNLVFDGGPRYKVNPGESIHIRDKSFKNLRGEDIFTWLELEKIQKVKASGFNKYFLSYVERQSDIDKFQELVGKEAEIWLKIESIEGMRFVNNSFKKKDNLVLVAARGDLFVELDQPHDILAAQRLIIQKDPEACVGSRILLSTITSSVPSCADLTEIAWLHDIGYRRMMLCDELCLKENMLASAVAVFDGIKRDL
jgi:pyruvate kinase